MRKTLLFLGLILALVCVNAHAENHELSTNCNVTSMASDRAQDDGPYTIGVTSNPTIGGTTTGAGDYESGQTCTLTATPNQGYVFANWTENGVPQTNNPVYSFTVIENRELVANFVASSYNISAYADPYIGGSVVGAGTYGYMQTCTLTATANPGYAFVGWTENGTNVSSSLTYSFTVTANRDLVAVFVAQDLVISVTVNPTNAGSVSGAGTYSFQQPCTLVATPNEGYAFGYWMENGVVVSEEAAYTFTVTENRDLVAQFLGTGVDENESEQLVLYPNPSEGTFVVEGRGKLSVVNPLGQQLFTRDIEGQTTLSLPSGFYLLRLENGNGSRMSKLLVK